MTPSAQLFAFTSGWESCCLTPYKDSAGLWTIGWGYLLPDQEDVPERWTQQKADFQLKYGLLKKADEVQKLLIGFYSQQQFDALVDFAYNLGSAALAGSTLLKRVNAGAVAEAADEFLRWDKARDPETKELVEVKGLLKRRYAERQIFRFGDYSGRP